MNLLFDAAWLLIKVLSYGGLAVALLGVAIFGWHFVRLNARAGRGDSGDIPRILAWSGRDPGPQDTGAGRLHAGRLFPTVRCSAGPALTDPYRHPDGRYAIDGGREPENQQRNVINGRPQRLSFLAKAMSGN